MNKEKINQATLLAASFLGGACICNIFTSEFSYRKLSKTLASLSSKSEETIKRMIALEYFKSDEEFNIVNKAYETLCSLEQEFRSLPRFAFQCDTKKLYTQWKQWCVIDRIISVLKSAHDMINDIDNIDVADFMMLENIINIGYLYLRMASRKDQSEGVIDMIFQNEEIFENGLF